jgi:hypothetical protein
MRFTAIPECIAVVELATLLSAQTNISGDRAMWEVGRTTHA